VVERYPVVVKPNGGRRGQQISLVRTAEELQTLEPMSGPVCAQEFIEGDGIDLKVYVIGQRAFSVMRPSPLGVKGEGRHLLDLSPEAERISLHCGEVFGLELYGVDLIETPDGPSVIEVNCFPGYKGVPNADHLLADHIFEHIRSGISRSDGQVN
jgi:ribosomal protein S6--L-glutamate ligase